MSALGGQDFDHILVYDVSRWGRFQDVDESTCYEFICKKKGFKVIYCVEQFSNDGRLLSSIAIDNGRTLCVPCHGTTPTYLRKQPADRQTSLKHPRWHLKRRGDTSSRVL